MLFTKNEEYKWRYFYSLEDSPSWNLVSLWHLHTIWYPSLRRIQLHLEGAFWQVPTALNMLRLVLLIHHAHYWGGILRYCFLIIRLATIDDLRRIFFDYNGYAEKGAMILYSFVVTFRRDLFLLLFFFETHRIFRFRFEFIKYLRYYDWALLIILILWYLFVISIRLLLLPFRLVLHTTYAISRILIKCLFRALLPIAILVAWA